MVKRVKPLPTCLWSAEHLHFAFFVDLKTAEDIPLPAAWLNAHQQQDTLYSLEFSHREILTYPRKQASVSFNFLTVFLKSQTNICTKAWTLKGTYINWLKSTHLLNTEIIAIPPWSSVTAAYAARQSQTILSALLRAPDTVKAQTSSQRQVKECHSPYPMQVLLTRSSLHHWIPSEAHQNTHMAFLSKTFSREGRKCSRVCCFRIVYVIKYSHSREVSVEGTCLAEGKDHHKLHLYGGTCNNHKLFQAKISTAFCTNKSCWLQKATKEKQRKGEGSADPQERLH